MSLYRIISVTYLSSMCVCTNEFPILLIPLELEKNQCCPGQMKFCTIAGDLPQILLQRSK